VTRIKSTRDSIRDQFVSACEHCDKILARFKRADELAAGKSPVLDQYLPGLVEAVDHFKIILDNVKNEL
jgi:hypothetical protein